MEEKNFRRGKTGDVTIYYYTDGPYATEVSGYESTWLFRASMGTVLPSTFLLAVTAYLSGIERAHYFCMI